MQLKIEFYFILCFLCIGVLFAQDDKPIEIDFLLNYYDQDGDHSAVTGGIGTEELNNIGTKIAIYIPQGLNKSLNIYLNADSYTSASSDNIDPLRSGASAHDIHAYGSVEFSVDNPESQFAYSLTGGLSTEFDYTSFSFGGSWSIYSANRNSEFTISTINFIDFITLIYPIELRYRGDLLSDDTRQTYSLSLNFNQVLSKKLQMSLMTDLVYQKGLLSTPFNRIYFNDVADLDVERLPDHRFKFPIGFRINYFLSDLIVTRIHYRFYNDTFGLSAHSISLETPFRLSHTWAIIPFVRYHDQHKADYFAPYKQHLSSSEFYTSDYDLSSFTSTMSGVGLRYYPLQGVINLFGGVMKRIDLRAGFYNRSDGLTAFNITGGVSLFFP